MEWKKFVKIIEDKNKDFYNETIKEGFVDCRNKQV